MRVGRLILVVSTLVTILIFPLLLRDAVQALRLPSAYAAASIFDPGGRVYQNGNSDNDNNNDGSGSDNDDQSDNEGEDNDNVECFASLNDNEPVPCDFEDNDNDFVPPPAPAAPSAPAPSAGGGFQPVSRRCFGPSETGELTLLLEGGSVAIRVVNAGFPQGTWVSLDDIEDLSGIPGPPAGATMLDRMIWRVDAGNGCDGAAVNPLPAAVNLGVAYNVSANKSKLQVVLLKNGVWQEVPTVPDPDPNKPYISATIQETGLYAVIQKP
jgi:hypothetical protein